MLYANIYKWIVDKIKDEELSTILIYQSRKHSAPSYDLHKNEIAPSIWIGFSLCKKKKNSVYFDK